MTLPNRYSPEDEFNAQMSEPADWRSGIALGLGIVGVILGAAVFILFTLAAVFDWALPFLTSPWGIGISATAVVSLVLACALLGRCR